jgi:hypothetical protein
LLRVCFASDGGWRAGIADGQLSAMSRRSLDFPTALVDPSAWSTPRGRIHRFYAHCLLRPFAGRGRTIRSVAFRPCVDLEAVPRSHLARSGFIQPSQIGPDVAPFALTFSRLAEKPPAFLFNQRRPVNDRVDPLYCTDRQASQTPQDWGSRSSQPRPGPRITSTSCSFCLPVTSLPCFRDVKQLLRAEPLPNLRGHFGGLR